MSLLTNDFDSDPDEIIAIYRKRWKSSCFSNKSSGTSRSNTSTGERQCHQNPDMGDIDSKPTADGNAERSETTVEFLRTRNNGTHHADVLRRLLQSVQQPRKGLGNNSLEGFRLPSRAVVVRLKGLVM